MNAASVVLATETVRQMKRMQQGITLDEERLMQDDILSMRFQGKCLSERSKRYFREEHLLPDLFARQTCESWEARGQSEEEVALARVQDLLGRYEPPAVAPEVRRELERIMDVAKEELAQ